MYEKELSELTARKDASMKKADIIHEALNLQWELQKHEDLKGIDMQLLFYSDKKAQDTFAVNYASTGRQRKEIMTLLKEKGYVTDKNVTELSYTEAAKVLDFLNSKTNIKPAVLLTDEEHKLQKKINMIENKYRSILENVYRNESASSYDLALIKKLTDGKPEFDHTPKNSYEARRILHFLQPNSLLTVEPDTGNTKKISKGQALDLELLLDANNIDYPTPVEKLSQAEFNNIMDYLINRGRIPEFFTSETAFTRQASIKNQLFEKSIAELPLDAQKLLVRYRTVLNDLRKAGITEDMFASTLSYTDSLANECSQLTDRICNLEYEYKGYLRLQHNIENAKNEDYCKDVYHGLHEVKEKEHSILNDYFDMGSAPEKDEIEPVKKEAPAIETTPANEDEEVIEEYIEPEPIPILEDKNLGIYDDMGLISIKNLTDDNIIITELHVNEKYRSSPFTLGPGKDNLYKSESFDLNVLKERGVEYIVDREVHLLNPESMAKGNTFDHYENVEDALKCIKDEYTPNEIYRILRERGYEHAEINTAMRWEGLYPANNGLGIEL